MDLIELLQIIKNTPKEEREGLDFSRESLRVLPPEIGKLTNITWLNLSDNKLEKLPHQIGKLRNLIVMNLGYNQLTELPREIWKLNNLVELNIGNNKFKEFPPEIWKITTLFILKMSNNQLTKLPPEIGKLTNLWRLDVDNNPLVSPSQEIVEQGSKAILTYLREQLKARRKQWVSKLLVVGEGGVGKTSLLRALKGEKFIRDLETTHGVCLENIEIKHPQETNVVMMLNAWDFGGQEIYHATRWEL